MMMKRLLFAFLLAGFVVGCGDNDSTGQGSNAGPEGSAVEDAAEATAKEEVRYYAIVDHLRVRDTPDKKGEVLGMIDYGDEAIFLEDESDFKEKITLRGKVYYDSWKQVRTRDMESGKSIEGWVFGGALMLEEDLYQNTSGDQYERRVVNATAEEVKAMLGQTASIEGYYNGQIGYRKEDGRYIKHGPFEVKGEKEIEELMVTIDCELRGEHQDGQLDGMVEREVNGYESHSIVSLYFKDGDCQFGTVAEEAEGEEYHHREENPKECTLDYIVESWVNEHY